MTPFVFRHDARLQFHLERVSNHNGSTRAFCLRLRRNSLTSFGDATMSKARSIATKRHKKSQKEVPRNPVREIFVPSRAFLWLTPRQKSNLSMFSLLKMNGLPSMMLSP